MSLAELTESCRFPASRWQSRARWRICFLGAARSARPHGRRCPAYCRMDGMIDRRVGAAARTYGIGFARSPPRWNGRFLFQGGGGLNGSVAPPLGRDRTGRGRAGPRLRRGDHRYGASRRGLRRLLHGGPAGEPGLRLPAVGRVAVLAKQILALHYGKPAHSYFMGCSTGGREGMLMAQRYPTYFDGIVVGAPAMRTSFSGIGDEWVATTRTGRSARRLRQAGRAARCRTAIEKR